MNFPKKIHQEIDDAQLGGKYLWIITLVCGRKIWIDLSPQWNITIKDRNHINNTKFKYGDEGPICLPPRFSDNKIWLQTIWILIFSNFIPLFVSIINDHRRRLFRGKVACTLDRTAGVSDFLLCDRLHLLYTHDISKYLFRLLGMLHDFSTLFICLPF